MAKSAGAIKTKSRLDPVVETVRAGRAPNAAVTASAARDRTWDLPLPPQARRQTPAAARACYHCGEPCPTAEFAKEEKTFCCQGCLIVHDLLQESGLGTFYALGAHPGVKVAHNPPPRDWTYLDDPALQQTFLDFTDGKTSRVTFHIPAIHCVACVWLLENLFRLHPGIGQSQVNFTRREVAISFVCQKLALSELVALLAAMGYEPQLNLGKLDKPKCDAARKKQWLQVGIAGFAFGNIMLFSFPGYLGLDSSGAVFKSVFGYLSLVLALPVLLYSASDYWRSASLALRQRVLTLDVPIAFGLAALYSQSLFEIVSQRGPGYLDSLSGLVFFLLCGRVFQHQTYERLAFDRDYKSFFPLSVTRLSAGQEISVALSNLQVGDRLRLRQGELIPADARLLSANALIDYSFVTGESEPVAKKTREYLYAGGRHIGAAIEIEIVKPVSQSYLTSLWAHEAFRKQSETSLDTVTNRYSRWFTRIVIAVAFLAAAGWTIGGDATRGLKAFTSVLIVACPCALALAAPFTFGTAQRRLAKKGVFVKNTLVLERLAEVDSIVFDKTGTLTATRAESTRFSGALSSAESAWIAALAAQSTHPHALRIAATLVTCPPNPPVQKYRETPGCGIRGLVAGHEIILGSSAWLEERGIAVPSGEPADASNSCLAIDGRFRGAFLFANQLRPQAERLLKRLGSEYDLALLSGDNEKERRRFGDLFGTSARLHFNHSPLQKLEFIAGLQQRGRTVMMVGDGLNDAGALKQSDIGVAVVEHVAAFSPACDVILGGDQLPRLGQLLEFARGADRTVRASFAISAIYNLAGVGIAAAGILSPLVCAVLMPLSSVSVVLFACAITTRSAGKLLNSPCSLSGSRIEAAPGLPPPAFLAPPQTT